MVSDVFPSLLLIIRILIAWFGAILMAGFIWNGIFERTMLSGAAEWLFNLASTLVMLSVLIGLISHLRRIWLITGRLDSTTLASRQRRQIELPMDAGPAFALLEAKSPPVIEMVQPELYRAVTR